MRDMTYVYVRHDVFFHVISHHHESSSRLNPWSWRFWISDCVWHVTILFMYVTSHNFRLPQLCPCTHNEIFKSVTLRDRIWCWCICSHVSTAILCAFYAHEMLWMYHHIRCSYYVTIQYAITYADITWFDAAIRFCEYMTYQYITIFDAATMSPFNMPTFNMPISRDSMQLFDSVNIWHITWWHITIFDAPTIYLYFTFLYHHILFQRPISRHSIRYTYGVATVSSVDSIIGLCCRISSLL